jgi:hypothetical protein
MFLDRVEYKYSSAKELDREKTIVWSKMHQRYHNLESEFDMVIDLRNTTRTIIKYGTMFV